MTQAFPSAVAVGRSGRSSPERISDPETVTEIHPAGPAPGMVIAELRALDDVTFEVLREGKNIQPALHFKSATDQYLFVVSYTDPAWLRVPPATGRHVATAWGRPTC